MAAAPSVGRRVESTCKHFGLFLTIGRSARVEERAARIATVWHDVRSKGDTWRAFSDSLRPCGRAAAISARRAVAMGDGLSDLGRAIRPLCLAAEGPVQAPAAMRRGRWRRCGRVGKRAAETSLMETQGPRVGPPAPRCCRRPSWCGSGAR